MAHLTDKTDIPSLISGIEFRHILENITDGYYEVDLAGTFTLINESHARIHERTCEEMTGMNYRHVAAPEDVQRIYKAYNSVFRTGKPVKGFEFALIAKDDTRKIVEITASPIHGTGGAIIGFRGTARDVTSRRKAQQELLKSEEKYRAILENIEDSYCETDLEGNITLVNESLCRLYGSTKQETLGMNYRAFMDETDANKVFDAFNEVYKTGQSNPSFQYVIRRKDGSKVDIEISISLNIGDHGKPVGFRSIVRDITQRKIIEVQMKQAKEAAEAANMSKSNFLANMSHEIRTPMNAVIGYADLLLDTGMNEIQSEYARVIKKSGQILVSLLNDILDFSKIEAKVLDFQIIEFDPELIVYDVVDMIRSNIESKNIELLCRIGDTVPARLKGDPLRFRQVITNILGNAVKFTDVGEIEISLQVDEETDDRVKLHATLRDTGIGIPADALSRVFEVFKQADETHSRKYGGTGLGLAICKKIARMMDGDTWAESPVLYDKPLPSAADGKGQGSMFHFTAWFDKSSEKQSGPYIPMALAGRRVLLADANETHGDIFTQILKNAGMEIIVVQKGAMVVSALEKAHASGNAVDVILADIHLEDMNGYELAKKLRRASSAIANIPMIALSGSMIREAGKCQDAGYNGFLTKPVQREKLFQMISSVISGAQTHDFQGEIKKIATQYTVREDMKCAMRILLVEDNLVNQKLAQLLLTKGGYTVNVANNGTEAVAEYTRAPDNYDLIFMDIQMPVMDGLEATRVIRKRGFKSVPIIALTAHALIDDRAKCLDAGMNDYVTKPIQREIVYRLIEKYVIKKVATAG